MARQWTSQQLKAIEADGTLTVLSAAAGSGKTTVLVEKALRMLLDEENKTPADRLLIVTFSNASAKEFKNRIEKGINQAIKQNPENAYIKSQKIALQKADISTIHSFCIKLTRENFEALDIAPDFSICDDAKSLAIHQKAIDAAMEYGYTMPDFSDFVTLFGKSSQDKQVREFLQYMYHYFSALPFPQQKAQQLCDKVQSGSFEESEVYKYLWKDIGAQIQYAAYLSERLKKLVSAGDIGGYENGALNIAAAVQRMEKAYKDNDVFMVKSIAADKLPPLGRVAKGGGSVYSEAAKSVNKTIGETFKGIAADMEYLDGERYAEDTAQTGRYIQAITKVFIFYSQKLMEIKKQEKAFEFSDFEHFAVKLLVNQNGSRTPLAKALSEKYVKIMEDEYQDTSYVQDMVFNAIAKDDEKNLFVVGDVKQSIYGFRKASPEILLKKRAAGLEDATKGTTIVLSNNFRSEVNIIRSVNCIFEQIMTKGLGGVDYKYGEQLLPAPNKTDSGAAGVEIIIAAENEAETVADKIYTMVRDGYKIDDNGTLRAVKYDDFCILLRNKKRFDEFADALKEKGIKSFVKDDKPLLEKAEIQSIVALLKVVSNPLQEVYLTAGMFGDIFGFTLDEILSFKAINRSENLYRLLGQSANPKAADFLKMLREFAYMAKIYSPDKLTDYIVNATGYYLRLSFDEKGGEKRENIRRFILFAKNYMSGYQSTLGDFLRYIDLCIETGKGQGENMHQPANTVAIMTMHTSKGLEFPVCFVSGLGTPFNKMDRVSRLMIDPVLGMATYANERFGYNRSTAGIQAIKKKVLAANADDEMRLMYVALTRAKNKMFLTAQYTNMFTAGSIQKIWEKTSEFPSEYALRKASTPIEWVLTAFVNHPQISGGYSTVPEESCAGCEGVRTGKADIAIKSGNDISSVAKFVFVGEDSSRQTFENTELSAQQQADTQADDIQRLLDKTENSVTEAKFDILKAAENLNWIYPNLAKTKLPIKVSVGEIAKAPPPVILKKPDFAVSRGATAAQKGTQMHLFAQHSDILLARTNLENEIEKLAADKVIDKKLINRKQIETFVNSDVAAIMLDADVIYKEKEFLVPYGADSALNDDSYGGETVLVQGVIDCLAVKGGKAYIIDYKTDRVDNMDILYHRYAKQLELYRYAAKYLYEIEDTQCIIYSFHLGEYIAF